MSDVYSLMEEDQRQSESLRYYREIIQTMREKGVRCVSGSGNREEMLYHDARTNYKRLYKTSTELSDRIIDGLREMSRRDRERHRRLKIWLEEND